MSTDYIPIFVREGNEFFLDYNNMIGTSMDDANRISDELLFERNLHNFELSRIMVVTEDQDFPYIGAVLGGMKIGLISGPIFERKIIIAMRGQNNGK